jgi:hypothetical protein
MACRFADLVSYDVFSRSALTPGEAVSVLREEFAGEDAAALATVLETVVVPPTVVASPDETLADTAATAEDPTTGNPAFRSGDVAHAGPDGAAALDDTADLTASLTDFAPASHSWGRRREPGTATKTRAPAGAEPSVGTDGAPRPGPGRGPSAATRSMTDDSATTRRKPDDSTARRRKPDDSATTRRKPDDSTARRRKPDDSATTRRKPDDSTARRRKPDDSTARRRKPDDSAARRAGPSDSSR